MYLWVGEEGCCVESKMEKIVWLSGLHGGETGERLGGEFVRGGAENKETLGRKKKHGRSFLSKARPADPTTCQHQEGESTSGLNHTTFKRLSLNIFGLA